MPIPLLPHRQCRSVHERVNTSANAARCSDETKARFDALHQALGHHVGHRVTQDDALRFALDCAAREGHAGLARAAREHFRRAEHAPPLAPFAPPRA